MTSRTELQTAADQAKAEVDRIHAAIWADPKNASLVGELTAAMKVAKEARSALENATGRTAMPVASKTIEHADRAHDRHLEAQI